jgi:tetratricopeptide (TPR) repeat protein
MKYYTLFFLGLFLLVQADLRGQNEINFSADSLYNLGNSAYYDQQFDAAIYYYEKARLLDPGAEDIITNLQLANERLSTEIIELKPFFLVSWWDAVTGLMLPGGWKFSSVLVLALLLLLCYFYLFKDKPKKKSLFYALLGVFTFFFLLTIAAGKTRTDQIYNSSFAIVFGNDQSLYLGPDDVSEEVKQVTGGNKLRILDEAGDWYKVSAMDSEQGWIKKEHVQRIKF